MSKSRDKTSIYPDGATDPKLHKLMTLLCLTGQKLLDLKACLHQEANDTGCDFDYSSILPLVRRFHNSVAIADCLEIRDAPESWLQKIGTPEAKRKYHLFYQKLQDLIEIKSREPSFTTSESFSCDTTRKLNFSGCSTSTPWSSSRLEETQGRRSIVSIAGTDEPDFARNTCEKSKFQDSRVLDSTKMFGKTGKENLQRPVDEPLEKHVGSISTSEISEEQAVSSYDRLKVFKSKKVRSRGKINPDQFLPMDSEADSEVSPIPFVRNGKHSQFCPSPIIEQDVLEYTSSDGFDTVGPSGDRSIPSKWMSKSGNESWFDVNKRCSSGSNLKIAKALSATCVNDVHQASFSWKAPAKSRSAFLSSKSEKKNVSFNISPARSHKQSLSKSKYCLDSEDNSDDDRLVFDDRPFPRVRK